MLFYDISIEANRSAEKGLPQCKCIAQLGGKEAGVQGRIKDFVLVPLPTTSHAALDLMVVTASSDGAVRFWSLTQDDLVSAEASNGTSDKPAPRQIGRLVSTHQTGNRITCLGAFIMDGKPGSSIENSVDGAEDAVSGEESSGDED